MVAVARACDSNFVCEFHHLVYVSVSFYIHISFDTLHSICDLLNHWSLLQE
jgi:hypothetical protein